MTEPLTELAEAQCPRTLDWQLQSGPTAGQLCDCPALSLSRSPFLVFGREMTVPQHSMLVRPETYREALCKPKATLEVESGTFSGATRQKPDFCQDTKCWQDRVFGI